MDSAKSVLQSIVLTTQQVRNSTAQYSTAKGVRRVGQHSLIRLESGFQSIINASRAILNVLNNPLLCHQYMLDDRLVDWLSGAEPEACLDVLREMGRLLTTEHEISGFSGFAAEPACDEDDLNAAIVLFHAHKAHFHFLLTTDIWGHGTEFSRQTIPLQTEASDGRRDQQPQLAPVRHVAVENHRKQIISQKLNKLLKLLDALDCSEKHRETMSLRQSDTCAWLPAIDAYRSWRDRKVSFLWLQGKAGAGKSVLASSVIENLKNTIDDGELLVYFYCDFRTRRSTSAIEVLRSILANLTAQFIAIANLSAEDLLDDLLKDSDSHAERFYTAKGLSHYISKVANLCPRTPLVVVDALDECREVESLLDGLIMSSGDLRIFATSRPLQSIISILSSFPCIAMDRMSDELSADILLHITRELDSRRRLRTFDDELKAEIRSTLCSKADGMFRWVQCQIDTLEKCRSVAGIRRVLDSLPEGLEETYRRILIAIDRRLSDARLVRRALVWLVTALRPLSMRELLEALMINREYRALDSRFGLMKGADLLDVCRSLVVHHEETDIITLSHMSVKEYLIGELVRAKLPRYHIILEDAHERLARLCMGYILFCLEQIKDARDRSSPLTRERDLRLATSHSSRPLLRYVLADGLNHLAHLGPGNVEIFKDLETLQMMTRRYAWEWDQMCKLVPSIRTGVPWPTSQHDFMFYILIAFGSDTLLATFVCHSGFTPRQGTNPLVYAAYFGQTAQARILISQGAEVNGLGLVVNEPATDDQETDNVTTPLAVAVDRWNTGMMDLLLAEGSIVPDALLARALGEHPQDFPLPIIRRLLQTGQFLKWAVTPWENRCLLEALLDNAEDYEHAGGENELTLAIKRLVQVGCAETMLLVAIEKGCIAVTRTLLSMDTPSGSGTSSAMHTHAIVNAIAPNGDTPIHVAMRLSDESQCLMITKLLVEAGCDPCELDADDKPPVHIAVVRGFISVVEYLLSQDVRLPSRILFAALQVTPLKRVEMIHFLMSRGANVRILNPDGDALLHVAMRSPDRSVCLRIAKIFTDAGCNPSARNLNGETPLCIAAKQEYHSMGDYLLLFGTPSDIRSLLDPDPSSQETALRLLICNVDGLHFLPEEESRLLQAFREFLDDEDKHLAVVRRLMDAPDGPSSGTAFIFGSAVRRGFKRVVEYLLSRNVPLPSDVLFTALRHRVSMVPWLIGKRADVHAKEKNGDTLLHVVIRIVEEEAQCLITVQALVAAGCYSSIPNGADHSPIDVAVSRGFQSVIEYLQSKGTPFPQGILFTALRRQPSMVSFLIRKGAEVLARERNGDTLLHVAIAALKEEECLLTMQVLFGAGCYPSVSNDSGQSPMDTAVSRGFVSATEYLLSKRTPFPSGILLTAVRYQPQMVPFLIRKGANLHAKDASGDTLLHVAIKRLEEEECLTTTKTLVGVGFRPIAPNNSGQLPIELAVSQGFVSVVEYLLSKHANLPRGILFTAIQHQVSMLPLLIRIGADLHAKKEDGDTLLHVAITKHEEEQCFEATRILVEAGCYTSTPNDAGRLPIEAAVLRGFVSVVEYLLSRRVPLPRGILFTAVRHEPSMVPLFLRNGVDIHVQEDNGDTPLHASMSIRKESQCHEAVEALVQAGCPTSTSNAAGIRPIHMAVSRGFISVVKYLLSAGPYDKLPQDLLFWVMPYHSSSSMVRILIDHGANISHIDSDGNGLLHHVMQFSDEEECLMAIQFLIQAGCCHFALNVSHQSPLHIAVENEFTSLVYYLISQDVPLPSDILLPALKSWPIYEREPGKWKFMASSFISRGANVHVQDTDGDTLMHHAMRLHSETQCLEATKILVEAGCSSSISNHDGELPLQAAVARGLFSVVEYLLSHDAPMPSDILLAAVQAQHGSSQVSGIVSLLVRNGADVSACTADGDSVLHVALARENYWFTRGSLLEVVKILVHEGCDTRARNYTQHTPLEVAMTMGYWEVADYLHGFVNEGQTSVDVPLPCPSPPAEKTSTPSPPPSPSVERTSPFPRESPPLSHPPALPTPTTPFAKMQQAVSDFFSPSRS